MTPIITIIWFLRHQQSTSTCIVIIRIMLFNTHVNLWRSFSLNPLCEHIIWYYTFIINLNKCECINLLMTWVVVVVLMLFLCILLLFNFMILIFIKGKKVSIIFFCLNPKEPLDNCIISLFIYLFIHSFSMFLSRDSVAYECIVVGSRTMEIIAHCALKNWKKKPNKATDNRLSYMTNEKTQKRSTTICCICDLRFKLSFFISFLIPSNGFQGAAKAHIIIILSL